MPNEPAAGVETYTFDDVNALRSGIYSGVRNAYASAYPIENKTMRLELSDVDYDDPVEVAPIATQRKAILAGHSLTRPLSGTWRLVDKSTNNVLQEARGRVADVPQMTQRGTFIYRGNEYTLAHQARLLPGVYTRRKENGELESHFNIMPGSGPSFRVFMEPETGVFDVTIGQSKIPLYPLLRDLGVRDHDLKSVWGNELLNVNAQQANKPATEKAYEKLVNTRLKTELKVDESSLASKAAAVLTALRRMQLDPVVTKSTLGTEYSAVDLPVVLAATKRLLDIRRGAADTDDRDNIAYQKIMGPADLFAERVKSDVGGIAQRLLWRATFKRGLAPVLAHRARNKQLESVLLSSGLGMPLEESNPLDIYDQLQRVSRMGYGGIPDTDAIPDESRAVQPSYLGFVDVVRTSESAKAGVDNRTSFMARRGTDGKMYGEFIDKSGKPRLVSSTDAARSVIAFPGELQRAVAEKRPVQALVKGRIKYVQPNEVDFELAAPEHMLSTLAHVVPYISSLKGHRTNMVARMVTQALALRDPEAPLVQTRMPGKPDSSFEQFLGEKTGIVRADAVGTVAKVDGDTVVVKTADGLKRYELYNNFPFNRRGFVHSRPAVKPGDIVKPGQLLASTNFTDANGELGLGKNLRTAYLPYKGMTVEDAIVISESAARKMASEHMYQHNLDIEDTDKIGKNNFISLFPSTYSKQQLDRFTDDGVIKTGTIVRKGDPLILGVTARAPKGQGVLARSSKQRFADNSRVWEYDDEGVVTDAHIGPRSANVVVKAYRPSLVGDKLTMRFGGKGVISQIVPDDKMPRNEAGEPMELLIHPFGTISRSNPAAILELALGKAMAKLKTKARVASFQDVSNLSEVREALRKAGLKDDGTETLLDPERNANLKNVLSGVQYWMKLHHSAEDKVDARGDEGGYTADNTPSKGGEGSAKRLGGLETMSLLSAGAVNILRDAKLVRGQRNDDFWRAFRLGYPPPTPNTSFVYRKFMDDLRAAGINVKRDGNYVHIMALTDKDIDKMSHGPVKNAETMDFESMKPLSGGFFDMGLTGGADGTGWSHIELGEPLPNPVFEESIRKLLGLTEQKLEDVLAGKASLPTGTGPSALQAALKHIDIDKHIEAQKAIVKDGAKSKRDDAIKRLRVLTMFKKTGIKPEELMLTKVPVMPPAFRPIGRGPRNMTMVSDPNYLYREVFLASDNLRDAKREFGENGAGEDRLALYNAFKALVGLSDPLQPKLQEKRVSGILSHAMGLRSSPKTSVFQRKLIGSSTDVVGRAVITPDPSLTMDQVGIPEEAAWNLYKPFVIRSMLRHGIPAVQAVRMTLNREREARDALQREMEARPVLINRAPTLHRFGIMAAMPVLAKANTLQVSPTVISGFGADFDGDSQNFTSILCLRKRSERATLRRLSTSLGVTSDFWGVRRMAGYITQVFGVKRGKEFEAYAVALEDFPRGELVRKKDNVSFFAMPPGVFVVAYDEQKKKPVLAEVSHWSQHENIPVVTVELSSKRQILTDDDPRGVYGLDTNTFKMVRNRPKDAIGMFVPRVHRSSVVAPNWATQIPASLISRIRTQCGSDKNIIAAKLELTAELGYLLGSFVSNGWVDIAHNGRTFLSITDDAVATRAFSGTCRLFGHDAPVMTQNRDAAAAARLGAFGKAAKHSVSSRSLAILLDELCGRGAHGKHLPPMFACASTEFRRALAEGLFDNDGTVSIAKSVKKKEQLMVAYSTVSLRLAREVVLLMRSLDVACRITPSKTPAGAPFWHVSCNADDFLELNLNLANKVKSERIARYRSLRAGSNVIDARDIVPVSASLAVLLRTCFDYKSSDRDERNRYLAASSSIKKGSTSRATARKLIEYANIELMQEHPHWADFVALVADESTTWDRVEGCTVTGITEMCYDLTVPGYETFMNLDGVILSNTMQFHVPVSDDAVREAKAKLLPSQNLLSVRNFGVHYTPVQEFMHGIFRATHDQSDKPARTFRTKADVLAAFRRGEIDADTRIKVMEA